jgi:hypothetical protein
LIQLIKVVIFCFYDFDLGGRFKGQLGKSVGFIAYSYTIMVNNLKTVMNSRKVYNICLIQLIKLDIFGFYDFDLRGRFKGHLGGNVGFIAYSYIIMVNNLKTVMNSRKVYNICLIQLIKLDIFSFYDFDLRGRFKGHLGGNLGFIAYSYIIMVNNLKTVMNSRKVYNICLIQLIKLDIFGFYDFDLRGRFKGHLGGNLGFIAYSYIIMVNNLKTVMNSRKVYITCLIQLIKLDIFSFYDFDLRGRFKGHLGGNLGFIAYSYIIMVNNLKTVMNLRKVYIT